ncbi:unnamed protein product [Clonostachys byssicola]|uniref:Uncharacterized protein n=1 Tax=Clonostachys byssicola TaxID=160290 RepID=A0A9N9Y3S6_9HYPO|nr:unnamed protein product [Clonostachys byssicola]
MLLSTSMAASVHRPKCGLEQDFRPRLNLSAAVYQFGLRTKALDLWQIVLEILTAPTFHLTRRRSVLPTQISNTAIRHRLFPLANTAMPGKIKCTKYGNAYSRCGDGINVWSAGGVLLGKALVPREAVNFCSHRDEEKFALKDHRI